jgi:ferredoxin-NADP reductase
MGSHEPSAIEYRASAGPTPSRRTGTAGRRDGSGRGPGGDGPPTAGARPGTHHGGAAELRRQDTVAGSPGWSAGRRTERTACHDGTVPVTRGFFRKRPEGRTDRLPPGQYDVGSGWPVLTAEATPTVDLDRWRLTVDGLVERPESWTWAEIQALPRSTYAGDIHCVTTWSKFDISFTGVSVDDLLAAAGPLPEALFVVAHSSTGYTTNLPLVTSPAAGPGWCGRSTVDRCRGTTAARQGSSCRTCTSGSRPSGSRGSSCWPRTGRGSGSRTATTTVVTRGGSSATRATRDHPPHMSAVDEVRPVATTWTTARIIEKELPTPTTVRLRMHVEERQRHRPGQHYLIRLRAPDDYTAQRSYSVASDDDDPLVELLVERLPGGEVSEFLADVAEVGDALEMRGPIGRWFLWDVRTPALCLVGGTGVVPAVAMTRTAHRLGRSALLTVVAVGRSPDLLPYAEELRRSGAHLAFTRHEDGSRVAGAPTREEIRPLLSGAEVAFVCGSARFAAYAETLLLDCGLDPGAIRVERFGPTG